MNKTSLFDRHVKLGAKMVTFAGFEMPVTYPGSLKIEYNAVRNKTGIFDVSHMGQLRVSGKSAFEFLQMVTINNVEKISSGKAQYSAMCYENGGIIDDLIIYRSDDDFLLVVNASNITKNLGWLEENKIADVQIDNESAQTSLIAIQGPESRDILKHITTDHLDLSFYSFKLSEYKNKKIMRKIKNYSHKVLCINQVKEIFSRGRFLQDTFYTKCFITGINVISKFLIKKFLYNGNTGCMKFIHLISIN